MILHTLVLGFACTPTNAAHRGGGSAYDGTWSVAIYTLRGDCGSVRVAARIVIEEVPLAQSWRHIDSPGGSVTAVAVPWGDLATAWFSTGIPNIETYAVVPRAAAIASRALNWVRPLLASAPGQTLLTRLANRASGPSEEQLRTGRCRLWGEVRNAAGERRTAQLETANGYRLTADGTIMAVQSLLTNVPPGGYYTPSMLLGARVSNNCRGRLPFAWSSRARPLIDELYSTKGNSATTRLNEDVVQ